MHTMQCFSTVAPATFLQRDRQTVLAEHAPDLTNSDPAAISSCSGRLGEYQRTKANAEKTRSISRNEPKSLVLNGVEFCRLKRPITPQVGNFLKNISKTEFY